jgi:hypothetical protein
MYELINTVLSIDNNPSKNSYQYTFSALNIPEANILRPILPILKKCAGPVQFVVYENVE